MHVLLVEDGAGDVRLMQEAFLGLGTSVELHVASDGIEAMAFLGREGAYGDAPRPDLILLDLNLPKMDGREVLARVRRDDLLRTIPVVILTTSDDENDITKCYELQANCYVKKPIEFDEFGSLVQSLHEFWLTKVKLPPQTHSPTRSVGSGTLSSKKGVSVKVLLVEDNAGDVRLMQEAFRGLDASIELHVASDGIEAMAFLGREGAYGDAPRPDLILLDLNLPKMDGREVLARIKRDDTLKQIPTVILTTSETEEDIIVSYQLQANCYLRKPAQWDAFDGIVRTINYLWLTKGRLPPKQAA
jgi:two-component system, chemotaxis family, response regulator Rcp1